MSTSQHHVIFIDGVCVLCNRLSRILVRLDSKKQFLFSTLDSSFTKKTLLEIKENSIVVRSQDEMIYTKSKAILFIICQLPYVRWIGILMKIIPVFALDYAYDRVAKNRYQWFGKHNSCPLLTDDRFIKE